MMQALTTKDAMALYYDVYELRFLAAEATTLYGFARNMAEIWQRIHPVAEVTSDDDGDADA